MNKLHAILLATACAGAAQAQFLQSFMPPEKSDIQNVGNIKIEAKHLSANRQTGVLVATGNVVAVAAPYRLHTDAAQRAADGHYAFAPGTMMTTCSNDVDHLHWRLTGEFHYLENQAAVVRDAWVTLFDVPVLWVQVGRLPAHRLRLRHLERGQGRRPVARRLHLRRLPHQERRRARPDHPLEPRRLRQRQVQGLPCVGHRL